MELADFPANLLDFESRFATEEACVAYLHAKRWPKGFACPKCDERSYWPLRGGRVLECRGCSKQTSLTAGSTFHGTHKPLRLWFRALALMLTSKQGAAAMDLERLLDLSHEIA